MFQNMMTIYQINSLKSILHDDLMFHMLQRKTPDNILFIFKGAQNLSYDKNDSKCVSCLDLENRLIFESLIIIFAIQLN